MAEADGVADLVCLAPRLPYIEAIAERLSATGLLLFQGSACSRQILARTHEYFTSHRPVVALMDPQGDTHALIH